jgi:uncharacterized protein
MSSSHANLSLPLSEAEFAELDQFLMSDATSDETLWIDALDGYLTAIAIGPKHVPLNRWFPEIWGPDEQDAPQFKSKAQAQHIIDLIFRHFNGIVTTLTQNLDDIDSKRSSQS